MILAEFGPFFQAEWHSPAGEPDGPWLRLTELDEVRLAGRVQRVQAALSASSGRAVEPRVAASVAQLGLVARVAAVRIGTAAVGVGPVTDVWWQDVLGGPFPLSVAPGAGADDSAAITTAVAAQYPVSPRVLWGNLASAANTAAQLIAQTSPALAAAARAAADRYLAEPRVEGGRLRAGPGFRRRSCCLIYRVQRLDGRDLRRLRVASAGSGLTTVVGPRVPVGRRVSSVAATVTGVHKSLDWSLPGHGVGV